MSPKIFPCMHRAPNFVASRTPSHARGGAGCMQGNIFGDMVFRDAGPSEDCLMLNVWTPANVAKKKLPVMVWIHGGGFVAGGEAEAKPEGGKIGCECVGEGFVR